MSKSESEQVVSVSARGQATIPKEFRDALGITTPGRVKFVRTESGDIVVRPIQSVTDLRGILAGQTDGEGRSPMEQLRAERERDKTAESDLRDRYTTESDDDNRYAWDGAAKTDWLPLDEARNEFAEATDGGKQKLREWAQSHPWGDDPKPVYGGDR